MDDRTDARRDLSLIPQPSSLSTRRFRPYPEYRDSGAEWLGEIPAHWEARRIKFGTNKIGSGKTPSGGAHVYIDSGIMLIRSQNVHFDRLRLEDAVYITEQTDMEMAGSRVREGDVLLNITGASLGRCCVTRLHGQRANVNQHVCIVRPVLQRFDPSFLAYAISSRAVQAQIFNNENGISRDALNFEQVGNLVSSQPPLVEQRAIAEFLDRETGKIDVLVAKKEQLIELLQEKRTALITHAVTKGLDPDVPMKDSDVKWLGDIPAHWSIERTKFVARLESGHTPSRQHPEYWENCTIPWFGLVDVWQIRDGYREYVYETNEKISELGLTHSSARLLPKGTVILSRTASVGFSAILGVDMATTQDFVNWVCGSRILPEYLLYVFRAMGPEFQSLTMGSTHQTIYMPDASRFCTPVPPVEEQVRIVAYIRTELTKIDCLISKIYEGIARLKEFRTALISAAVTGKIDVREEVA